MFRYNRETLTVEDSERGLVVKQTGGAPELFVGEIVASDWALGFLVVPVEWAKATPPGSTPAASTVM